MCGIQTWVTDAKLWIDELVWNRSTFTNLKYHCLGHAQLVQARETFHSRKHLDPFKLFFKGAKGGGGGTCDLCDFHLFSLTIAAP